MTDRIGQRLGNYRLVRQLGEGGFAEVYLGEHIYLKNQAAIKILHTRLAKEDLDAFLLEARTLVALKHPHIVRILEFGVEESLPFLVMDYASHGTLRERHPKGAFLPLETLVPYVNQMASALQYAHDHKLIHRDIKPENMLIQSDGDLLLSDFGIALIVQSSRLQDRQDVVGTASYMAPEQIQGKARVASDQYALAVIVYEWLSGFPPFHGSFTEVCAQHIFAPPPPLHVRVPTIPPAIEDVVMRALAKDPQYRFARIQDFAEALNAAYLSVRPLPVESSSPGSQTAQPIPGASLYGPSEGSAYTPAQNKPENQAVQRAGTPQQAPTPFSFYAHDTNQRSMQLNEMHPVAEAALPASSAGSRNVLVPRHRAGFVTLLIVLAALLIIGGGSFLYTMINLPASPVHSTSIALHANASETAHAAETAKVYASETASTPLGFYFATTSGTPTLNSSLSAQDAYNWQNTSNACSFVGGAYHARMEQQGTVAICLAQSTNFSNFAFQVQMTIVRGDGGGLIFRDANQATYRFRVSSDGTFDLVNQIHGLIAQSSTAIKAGVNQTNLLTVIAQGSSIKLYINRLYITTINDTASSSGAIGLFAVDFSQPTDVAFSNAQVWQL